MALKCWILGMFICFTGYCSAQQGIMEKANNFDYFQEDGKSGSLYTLKSEMILLYFYDPSCEDCHVLMEQLNTSVTVNQLIAEKRLQVLAIYPEDDIELWTSYVKNVPENWINGFDKGATINMEGLFLFTSLPALYLLNEDKDIILQTKAFGDIEKELKNNIINN